MRLRWKMKCLIGFILFCLLAQLNTYGQPLMRENNKTNYENPLVNKKEPLAARADVATGCTALENIVANSVRTYNKVQVTFSFSGSISTNPNSYGSCTGIGIPRNSLRIGEKGAWNGSLIFDKPVNDIVIYLTATGPNREEDFIFTSNAGQISISSDYYCATTIKGNVISSGKDAISPYGGGGLFRLTAPRPFTKLELRGSGGDGGSLIAICSESVRPQAPNLSPLTPAQQSVCRKEVPQRLTVFATGNEPLSYQWYKHSYNSNIGGQAITAAKASSYTPLADRVMGVSYYYVVVTDAFGNSKSSDVATVRVKDCDFVCYKPGAKVGKTLGTKVGLTTLNLNQDKLTWPLNNKGAWLVLESKTKGFVPNRVPFDSSGNPIGIASQNFVEGMLVYDTRNNVLKVYTTTNQGLSYGWYEMSVQTCPD